MIKKIDLNSKLKQGEKYLLHKYVQKDNDPYIKKTVNFDSELNCLSNRVREDLDVLFNNDDFIVGIHKIEQSEIIDAFENGIIDDVNYIEDESSNSISIEQIVSFYKNPSSLVKAIKQMNLQNSEGVAVVKIPRYYINNYTFDNVEKPIYYIDKDSNFRLLPEFVYGFMSVESSGNIKGILENKKYNDIHEYSTTGLIEDGQKISKISNPGKNI